MSKEEIKEYKVRNGTVTGRFHGEPDYNKIIPAAEKLIKAYLKSTGQVEER
ncbi:MAG: hypothetical protein ACLUFN_07685 [Eubacterium sp.]